MSQLLNEFIANILTEETPAEKAKAMGLTTAGYGNWKNAKGAVTHKTVDGKLVPVAAKPDKKAAAKKKAPVAKPTAKKPTKQPKQKTAPKAPAAPVQKEPEAWSANQVFGSLMGTTPVSITRGNTTLQVRPIIDPATGKSVETGTPAGRKKALQVIDARLAQLDKPIKDACTVLTNKATEAQRQRIKKWMGHVGELYSLREMLAAGAESYLLPDSYPKNDIVVITSESDRGLKITEVSVKSSTGEEVGRLGSNARGPLHAAVEEKNITINGTEHKATDAIDASMFVYAQLLRFATEGHITGEGREITVTPDKMGKFDKAQIQKAMQLSKEGKKSAQDLLLQARKLTMKDIAEFKKSSLYTLPKTPEQRELIDHFMEQISTQINQNKDFRLTQIRDSFTSQVVDILQDTQSSLVFESDLVAVKFSADKGYEGMKITPSEIMKYRAEQKFGKISSMSVTDQLKKLGKWRLGTRGLNTHHPKTREARPGYAGAIINVAPPADILTDEDKLSPSDFINYINRPAK